MTITVQNAERLSLAEMREFVEGSRAVEGTASEREAEYQRLVEFTKSRPYRTTDDAVRGTPPCMTLRATRHIVHSLFPKNIALLLRLYHWAAGPPSSTWAPRARSWAPRAEVEASERVSET